MTAPDKIWIDPNDNIAASMEWRGAKYIDWSEEYTRSDLIPAMLAEARTVALREIMNWHLEVANHDQSGLEYSSLVGIPISNADELKHSVEAHEYSARHIASLIDATAPAPAQPSVQEAAFLDLMREGIARGEKAMQKYPQPNYIITKFAEEAGEIVKAAVHHAEGREARENVLDEIRDTIGMLWRLWVEGDEVHGMRALASEDQT